MKKLVLITLAILLSLTLAACGSDSDKEVKDNGNVTEKENDNGTKSLTKDFKKEDLIDLAEKAFEGIGDLPMGATALEEVDLSDVETVNYITGLLSTDNVEVIVRSMPAMALGFEFALIKANDDADIEAMKQEIIDNVDPVKWICAVAEMTYVSDYGHVIILVMADPKEMADEIYKGLETATENKLGKRLEKEGKL